MSDYPRVTYKRHTFLSSLAMGFSAIVIAIVVSCTVVLIYGIHFAGDQSEKLVSMVGDAIGGLPELREALPPVLSDALDDRRDPAYGGELDISAVTALTPDQHRTVRTRIEVKNRGSEIVSLLCLRIVVFGQDGQILSESNEWAATPIAAEDEWRGPLMPGSHRHFVSHRRHLPVFLGDELRTEVEIVHLRLWNRPGPGAPPVETTALPKTLTNELHRDVQVMREYY